MSTVAARTLLCPDRLENGAEPRLRYGSNVPPQAPASHGRPASSARPLARVRTRGVVDVDCAVGHAPCLEPFSAFGYAIDEAEIIYWGLCPACRIDS